jgi:hypothetical protein
MLVALSCSAVLSQHNVNVALAAVQVYLLHPAVQDHLITVVYGTKVMSRSDDLIQIDRQTEQPRAESALLTPQRSSSNN